jgi:hypothetical protein
MRAPGLTAILGAITPEVGHFYNGRILAGVLWLIITPGLWIGTGGLLDWVCHVIAAYTAYTYAQDHRVRIWGLIFTTARRRRAVPGSSSRIGKGRSIPQTYPS